MKKLIPAILLFAFSTSASAAFSGADLLGQCRKFVEIIEGGKTDLQHTLQAGLCGGSLESGREEPHPFLRQTFVNSPGGRCER